LDGIWNFASLDAREIFGPTWVLVRTLWSQVAASIFLPQSLHLPSFAWIEEKLCDSYLKRVVLASFEAAAIVRDTFSRWQTEHPIPRVPMMLHALTRLLHFFLQWVRNNFGVVVSTFFHVALNRIVQSIASTKRILWRIRPLRILAHPPGDPRTFDMRAGPANYVANVSFCSIQMWYAMRFPFIGVRAVPWSASDAWISEELLSHLLTLRNSADRNCDPVIVRERIIALARASGVVSHDRATGHLGWAANTVDLAANIIQSNSAAGPIRPLLLYGYTLDDVPTAAPPNIPVLVQFHDQPSLSAGELPVAVQNFPSPNYVLPKPDPTDDLLTLASMAKRVATAHNGTDPQLMALWRQFVEADLRGEFGCPMGVLPSEIDVVSPEAQEEWLSHTHYTAGRKDELRAAHTRFLDRQGRLTARDKACNCFIKDEHYPAFKFSRQIYSRSDVAKTVFGPSAKHLEKVVYSSCPENVKYTPIPERPAHIVETIGHLPGVWLESDVTACESSYSPEVMAAAYWPLLEHVSSRNAQFRRRLRLLYRTQVENQRCRFKNFTASFRARLMSGEMTTSVQNFWVIREAIRFAVWFNDPAYVTRQFSFHEGDDAICRLPAALVPTEAFFTRLGFSMKLEVRESLATSSFCGMVFDEVDLVPLADVRAVLSSMAWAGKRYVKARPARLRDLQVAKLYSYAYQYYRCPVIYPICWRYLARQGFPPPKRGFLDLWETEIAFQAFSYLSHERESDVPIRSRLLVERLYGVSVTEQIRLEDSVPYLDRCDVYSVSFDVPDEWNVAWLRYVDAPQFVRPRRAPFLNQPVGTMLQFSLVAWAANLTACVWRTQDISQSTQFCNGEIELTMNGKAKEKQTQAKLEKLRTNIRELAATRRAAPPPPNPTGKRGAGRGRGRGGARGNGRDRRVPQIRSSDSHPVPSRAPSTPMRASNPRDYATWSRKLSSSFGPATAPAAVGMSSDDMPHLEPGFHTQGDSLIMAGTEYLSGVSWPAESGLVSIPAGQCVFAAPLNPNFIPNLRVSRAMSMYDQFKIRNLVITYVPTSSSLATGLFSSVMVPDSAHNPLLDGAPDLIQRDILSRVGSAVSSVWETHSTKFYFPQQKWYYTRANEGADEQLTIPGVFYLVSATDIILEINDALVKASFGLLWIHYDLEFRNPGLQAIRPLNVPLSALASFTGGYASTGQGDMVWSTIDGMSASRPGMLFTAIVYGSTGGGAPLPLLNADSGVTGSLVPGQVVFCRIDPHPSTGPTVCQLVYFPSYAAMLAAVSEPGDSVSTEPARFYDGSWRWAANYPTGTRNVLLTNISVVEAIGDL